MTKFSLLNTKKFFCQSDIILIIKKLKGNSLDPDKVAHNKPPHLGP